MTKILITAARFYEDLVDALIADARQTLKDADCVTETITVPGALEIPHVIAAAHRAGGYDAFVALGAVIRGETWHFEIVANESARAIMDLSLTGVAVGNGILTCDTMDQAWARARPTDSDPGKGGHAAHAALRMHEINRNFSGHVAS